MTSDDKELQEQVQDEIQEFIPEYNPEDFEGLNLSPQEIYFAYLNVKHNDAVRAYQEAFGVPYKTALVKGKRLAKTPKIKEATMILYDEIWQEAMAVLPIRLMRDLENIRSLNIASYMSGDRFKYPDELTEEQQLMIEEVQYQTNNKTGETILVYKFPNKGSVYSKYMELIKMQKETSKDKESTSTDREAAEIVQSIFKNIGASNENK